MNRRRYLATVGAALGLAGCVAESSGDATGHQRVEEGAWHSITRQETLRGGAIRAKVDVPTGRYAVRVLEPDRAGRFLIGVDTSRGHPVDVFTMARDTYEQTYTSGSGDLEYDEELSLVGVEQQTTRGALDAGAYMVVVDNTSRFGGEATGDEVVELAVGIQL